MFLNSFLLCCRAYRRQSENYWLLWNLAGERTFSFINFTKHFLNVPLRNILKGMQSILCLQEFRIESCSRVRNFGIQGSLVTVFFFSPFNVYMKIFKHLRSWKDYTVNTVYYHHDAIIVNLLLYSNLLYLLYHISLYPSVNLSFFWCIS